MNPMIVTWEAVLDDGEIQREAAGLVYKDINRDRLTAFNLVGGGELLLHFPIPDTSNGHNFVYRRRTAMGYGPGGSSKFVFFVVGLIPMGPIVAVSPQHMEYAQAERFVEGHDVFYPPVPHPEEGEQFNFKELGHSVDARLAASRIVLPSGMKMDIKR